MKTYRYAASGDAFTLALEDRPALVPGVGEVVVHVQATSLNYRDLVNLRKQAGREVGGRIPLSDGAGTITAVGEGVSRFAPGDRVAGCFFQKWEDGRFDMYYHRQDLGGTIDGMLAEEVLLPETGLVRIPAYLSFEEAACLPCAALTAWSALVVRGGLKPGQSVLTLGTGGVSIFALQLAVALGARVFITSSSDDKLKRAQELGAAATINYRTHPDWEKEIARLTDKRGVDHVMEVGGPATLGKSLAAVAAGGHVALIGVLTGFGPPQNSLFPLVARNATMSGIYVGSRADFERMNAFLAEKRLRPVIDRVFAFAEAPAAFDYLASGRHFGKVVIRHAP